MGTLKPVDDNLFKQTVTKILNIIKSHTHNTSELTDCENKRFVSQEEKENIHIHNNKDLLDGITQSKINQWDTQQHVHENKDSLDAITPAHITDLNSKMHEHGNQSILDNITSTIYNGITSAIAAAHTHNNKDIIDTITQAKINQWDTHQHVHENKESLDQLTESHITDLNTKMHEHDNKLVLDSITLNKISSWDNNTHSHSNKTVLDQLSDGDLIKINQAHAHSNKNVIDDISLDKFHRWEKTADIVIPDNGADGTKFLADDGIYKAISSTGEIITPAKWDEVTNKPFDSIDSSFKTTTSVGKKSLSLRYPTVPCTKQQFLQWKNANTLDVNTMYVILDDNEENGEEGNGGSSGSSIIVTGGNGLCALFNDGTYKKIIDDSLETSAKETYSINKMKEVIDTNVTTAIANATDGSVRIWQKTKLNVISGETFEVLNTENEILTKKPIVVQAYKFVDGEQDVAEILKVFNNSNSENFVFNPDACVFDELNAAIKSFHEIKFSLNEAGYYESETINKSDYEIFDRIV